MKSKIILSILILLAAFSAVSAQMHQGVVEQQIQGNNIIIISEKQYLIDHSTIIHGMVRRGETGPIFNIGTKLGFNLDDSNIGEIQHISEGWFLE